MWVGWKKQDTSGKTLNISLNATSNATSSSKQL